MAPRAKRKAATERTERVMLFMFDAANLNVLVPRARGEGFLKSPLWHSASAKHAPELRDIADAAHCDVHGLDGHLVFDCGRAIATYPDKRAAFARKIMPQLAELYGASFREVPPREFWAKHPIPTS